PRSGSFDNVVFYPQVDDLANLGNTLTKHDVKFSYTERGSHFVFDNLDLHTVTRYLIGIFNLRGTTDIQTYRSIKFQRITSGGGLWIAKHHTDLLAQLVDEDTAAVGFGYCSC